MLIIKQKDIGAMGYRYGEQQDGSSKNRRNGFFASDDGDEILFWSKPSYHIKTNHPVMLRNANIVNKCSNCSFNTLFRSYGINIFRPVCIDDFDLIAINNISWHQENKVRYLFYRRFHYLAC